MIKKVITDAGRVESGFQEENKDCTVRALAKAGGISYEQAAWRRGSAGRMGNNSMSQTSEVKAEICSWCSGTGAVMTIVGDVPCPIPCPNCNGTGQVHGK